MKTQTAKFVAAATLLFVATCATSVDDLAMPEGGSSLHSVIDEVRGVLESTRLIPKETRQPHGRAASGEPGVEEDDVWHEVEAQVEYSPSKDTFMEQVAACIRERRCLASADATKRTTVTMENLARPAFSRRQETYVLAPCDVAAIFEEELEHE